MTKASLLSSSTIRVVLLILLISVVSLSCQNSSTPTHYDNPSFSFDYPGSWQTMEELWGSRQPGQDYDFGLQEVIMITSASKKGVFGAYFVVASGEMPQGEDIETVVDSRFGQIERNVREVSLTSTSIAGYPAREINYERARGDPWWQFRDLWLEKDGTIYLLSFHCLPGQEDRYQEDLDLILNSFSFK